MNSPDKGADVSGVSPKKAKKNGIKWSSSFAFDEWAWEPADEEAQPVYDNVPDVLKEADRLLTAARSERDIEAVRAMVLPLLPNRI